MPVKLAVNQSELNLIANLAQRDINSAEDLKLALNNPQSFESKKEFSQHLFYALVYHYHLKILITMIHARLRELKQNQVDLLEHSSNPPYPARDAHTALETTIDLSTRETKNLDLWAFELNILLQDLEKSLQDVENNIQELNDQHAQFQAGLVLAQWPAILTVMVHQLATNLPASAQAQLKKWHNSYQANSAAPLPVELAQQHPELASALNWYRVAMQSSGQLPALSSYLAADGMAKLLPAAALEILDENPFHIEVENLNFALDTAALLQTYAVQLEQKTAAKLAISGLSLSMPILSEVAAVSPITEPGQPVSIHQAIMRSYSCKNILLEQILGKQNLATGLISLEAQSYNISEQQIELTVKAISRMLESRRQLKISVQAVEASLAKKQVPLNAARLAEFNQEVAVEKHSARQKIGRFLS